MRSHEDLDVYRLAHSSAVEIFQVSKSFPKEERYSLTDQVRRSSRSVCANIAEAFRKRRYPKSFVLKLSDAEAEAAETLVWLDFSLDCGYIDDAFCCEQRKNYDQILAMVVTMIRRPDDWAL